MAKKKKAPSVKKVIQKKQRSFVTGLVVIGLILLGIIYPLISNVTNNSTLKPTPTVESQKKDKEDFYTVKEGDYLYQIALEQYGDGEKWYKIVEANDLQNPDFLSKGSRLRIPRD